MRSTRSRLGTGALVGATTAGAVIGLTYLGNVIAGLPFVPFDLFDWLARALPGDLVTLGIDSIVAIITGLNLGETSSTAKLIEQTMAILQLVGGGVIFGVVLAWRSHTSPQLAMREGMIGGAILLVITVFIEVSLGLPQAEVLATVLWLGTLFLSWGALLGRTLVTSPALPAESVVEAAASGLPRRSFVGVVSGGSLAAAVVAVGLGRLLDRPADEQATADVPEFEVPETSGPAASPSEEELANRIEPAPGTRAEVTDNADFYRIDINTMPPEVDINGWSLTVEGLVNQPLSLSIEDILAMPAVTQVVTMQCISNPVGGDLTSTSRWTGVPFSHVLDQAGLGDGAREVFIESADGFYESVSLEDAYDGRTLLVYAMNGVPLPVEHGFPLRIYMPNRYGMKQPKWIVRMEVLDEEGPGYWVDRGWSQEAYVNATSVIDNVASDQIDGETGTVPVGGIAWAGERGISRVEVQVDEGEWVEAELRNPPQSPLTWVQWRYDWPFVDGQHTFAVRAYDGDGELQILDRRPARPDGATGIHTFRLRG